MKNNLSESLGLPESNQLRKSKNNLSKLRANKENFLKNSLEKSERKTEQKQKKIDCVTPRILTSEGKRTNTIEENDLENYAITERPTAQENEKQDWQTPKRPAERLENTITKTKKSYGPLFIPEKTEETLPEVYNDSHTLLQTETFQSMNSIDGTVKLLKNCMTGMFAGDPERDIRLIDPHKVKIAAHCAKEIAGLLKVKLEAVKVAKSIMKDLKKDEEK